MESAISPHLVCPRSRARRRGDDYVPPYPAWSARIAPSIAQLVVANMGVQWNEPALADHAFAHIDRLRGTLDAASMAREAEIAHYVDEAGYDTLVLMAYWIEPAAFERWHASDAVAALASAPSPLGRFWEILTPSADRLETLFSVADEMEGAGRVLGDLSPEVQEHAYWGSARDRLPIAQNHALSVPAGARFDAADAGDGLTILKGHANVAMIRSGQDWGPTGGEERRLYLEQIEPILRAGMEFLRDRGQETGCYANRYMRMIGSDREAREKSFGWSYWRSLEDMEKWSEQHATHLAIFGTFMQMVQKLNFDLKLRLWHEVYVLTPDQQHYEYRNCHPRTGLLRAVNP